MAFFVGDEISSHRLEMIVHGPTPIWRRLSDGSLFVFPRHPWKPRNTSRGRFEVPEDEGMPLHKGDEIPEVAFVTPPPVGTKAMIPGQPFGDLRKQAVPTEATLTRVVEFLNRNGLRIVWLLWEMPEAPGWICATRLRDRRPIWFPPEQRDVDHLLRERARRRDPVATWETDPRAEPRLLEGRPALAGAIRPPRPLVRFDAPPPIGTTIQAAPSDGGPPIEVRLMAAAPIHGPGGLEDFVAIWRMPCGREFFAELDDATSEGRHRWRGPRSIDGGGRPFDEHAPDYAPQAAATRSAAHVTRKRGGARTVGPASAKGAPWQGRRRMPGLDSLVEVPPLGFRLRVTQHNARSWVTLIRVQQVPGGKPVLWWRSPRGKLAQSTFGEAWMTWVDESVFPTQAA